MTGRMTASSSARVYRLDDYRRGKHAKRAPLRLKLLCAFVAAAALVLTWQCVQGLGQDRQIEKLSARLGAVEQRTAYIQGKLGLDAELPSV